MYPFNTEHLVIISITSVTALVVIFLMAVTLRRVKKTRYYRRLDLARRKYEITLPHILVNGLPVPDECYRIRRFSPEWQAIEEILLSAVENKLIPVDSVAGYLYQSGYIDTYIKNLGSGNKFRRALAAEKLGRFRISNTSSDLIKILNDPSREVRTVAVRAIGAINATDALKPLIELLVPAVQDPEFLPLRVLKTAIKKYKGPAIPYLSPLLHHNLWRVRAQATDIIGEIGTNVTLEELLPLLNDPEPDVRAKAARALGKVKAKEAVQPLGRKIKDTSWVVRLQIAKALGSTGGVDAVPLLLELVSDTRWQIRAAAANSLCRLGNFAIPSLLRMLLHSKDRYAREQIVEELQKTNILNAEINKLGSKNKKERDTASILLVAAGSNGAINLIEEAVKFHLNPDTRIRLVHVLSLINHPGLHEILSVVSECDENEGVRFVAKKVLEKEVTQSSL